MSRLVNIKNRRKEMRALAAAGGLHQPREAIVHGAVPGAPPARKKRGPNKPKPEKSSISPTFDFLSAHTDTVLSTPATSASAPKGGAGRGQRQQAPPVTPMPRAMPVAVQPPSASADQPPAKRKRGEGKAAAGKPR